VLERWIADRPFREAHTPGQSDLDVARGTHGREILQDHWRNWIVESDWAWLAETGINTVRIPVSLMTPSEPYTSVQIGHFSPILLPGTLIPLLLCFAASLGTSEVARLSCLCIQYEPPPLPSPHLSLVFSRFVQRAIVVPDGEISDGSWV